jgi:hypothetical protein
MKVTKWSTSIGELTVNEQKPEETSGEPISLSVVPAVSPSSDAQSEPVAASAQKAVEEVVEEAVQEVVQAPSQGPANAESPRLAPEQAVAAEMPKADAPKADSLAADAPIAAAAEADAPPLPGKVVIMSSGDRAWANHGKGSEQQAGENKGMFGNRRIAAIAAVVALAIAAGALGGALATAARMQATGDDAATGSRQALEASVARIEADIQALKTGLEHTSKLAMSQFNKTSERLDKLDKAQAEPAAKLARSSEAVDKLRAPTAAPVPVAAVPATMKEVTGSVTPPAEAASAAAPKTEVSRLPTIEGWVLRDVARGGALIDGRRGVYEVYAGDFVPGLGRVDAIRRQDGRWVVVTTKGLIVAR